MIRVTKDEDKKEDEKTANFSEVLVRWAKAADSHRQDADETQIYPTEEPI